ncbi:hypothetical protein MMC31_006410 [Peltigera leucophlebia]|nr:hypothetical protein [Peltigera leucophlebia]
MDYTGGIDIDQRENGTMFTKPVAQAAPQHPSSSTKPTPQIASPGAPASAPHIQPFSPHLPTRTYPPAAGGPAAGGPDSHSPWDNSVVTASRTTLPTSTWPPPPTWVPPAPYHVANFPPPYPGPPAPFYANTPLPSYNRPPPTQPSGSPTPGEYVWNPSLGCVNDPSPPNAPAASPGSAKASATPSTTSRGRGKQGRHSSKDGLQNRASSQGERLETHTENDMEEEEKDGMEGKEGRKSGRNRSMLSNEKLALVGFCAEYADEYAMNQRQKYWGKIAYLLKEKTGYALKSPRLTVEKWIKAQMGEHTLDRLGFTTQVELDEFHTAVEKFGERWQAVAKEREQLQKSQAALFASEKITKFQKEKEASFDPALLQKRLVNTIEDEPLPTAGLENPAQIFKGRNTPSVFPNGPLKRRRLEDSSHQLRETAELMVAGMKDSIGALTEGLRQSAEAVVGDRGFIGRIEVLEKSNGDTHDALERSTKAVGDLSARLTHMEAGLKTLLEFLTKKMDDVDNHSSPPPSRQAQ